LQVSAARELFKEHSHRLSRVTAAVSTCYYLVVQTHHPRENGRSCPCHVTLNTSASAMSPYVDTSSGPNSSAAASAGAAGPFTGLRAGGSSGKPPPSCRYRRTFPRTMGRPGAADAAVDSAGAAVPLGELRAGRIHRMAMPECTAASGHLDHATFRERADASVRCKLLHADRLTGLGPGSK
jgi:hypothetical protein